MLFTHSKTSFLVKRIIILLQHKLKKWYWQRYEESTTVFDTVTQFFFDTKKTLYLKEHTAKPLKANLKDDGNMYLVVI